MYRTGALKLRALHVCMCCIVKYRALNSINQATTSRSVISAAAQPQAAANMITRACECDVVLSVSLYFRVSVCITEYTSVCATEYQSALRGISLYYGVSVGTTE